MFTVSCFLTLSLFLNMCVIQQAAKANMEKIQAKLQEQISCGQLNSFDRLSNLFSGNAANKNAANNDDDESDGGDVVMGTTTVSGAGKDPSKIPAKKGATLKHLTDKMTRQYGTNTTRKVNEKKKKVRRNGVKVTGGTRLRSSSKKRGSGKKLASI